MAGTNSSTDVHKIQRHNVGNMTDMITNLPEDVLLHILSLLRTKDAVRTSILANKWRHLWTYLSAFSFGTHNQNTVDCLLDLVGRLLNKSNHIESLCVQIYNNTIDADKIISLISSASKHNLQYLELSLGGPNDKFVLPHSFSAFESLNELHLGPMFTLDIPNGIRFPSLKKLVVSNVTFLNENSVQQLFSGCPILQELTFYDCYWENIMHISIAISTLRKLTIDFHGNHDDNMTFKIDAVNLLYLNCYCYPAIKFIPVNMTSIVDAFIDLGCEYIARESYAAQCAMDILSGLSSVKSLKLHQNTLECLYHTKDTLHLLPTFHNLTHLDIDDDVDLYECPEYVTEVLIDILRKTPKLEVLNCPREVLHYLAGEDLILNSLPCCLKSSLRHYEDSGDESDEDEAAKSQMLPAADAL